jgi:hypothetical protein
MLPGKDARSTSEIRGLIAHQLQALAARGKQD